MGHFVLLLWSTILALFTSQVHGGYYEISAEQDPVVSTAGGEHFHLDVPCRYELVNVVTNSATIDGGYCHIQIYAYNELHTGRFFVRGWDMCVTIYYGQHTTYFKGHMKVDGTASHDVYSYDMAHKPQGSDGWIEAGGDYIEYFDPNYEFLNQGDRVSFQMPDCHFRIDFKAQDKQSHPSSSDPSGIHVFVEEDQVQAWPKDKYLVGLPPQGQGMSADGVAEMYELEKSKAFTERVFHAHIDQDFKGASKFCQTIKHTVNNKEFCEDKQVHAAFDMCTELLKDPHYVSCVSKDREGSDGILEQLSNCLNSFCKYDIRELMTSNCGSCSVIGGNAEISVE